MNDKTKADDAAEQADTKASPVERLVMCDSYAYESIAEYEEIVGAKVNDAFRIGWEMARTTINTLRKLDT